MNDYKNDPNWVSKVLDYLDSQVDAPLFPRTEPARHRALKIAALATGMADKAVSLFYERRLHDTVSQDFDARCQRQIGAVLTAGVLAVIPFAAAAALRVNLR